MAIRGDDGPATAERVREAASAITVRLDATFRPRVGLILGSGLGDLADRVQSPVRVAYRDIPHFPVSAVQGHAGELVLGTLGGASVAVMRGRAHFYEGHTLRDLTLPVRVLGRLGVGTLVVTNAAGGLSGDFHPGDLMLITDHLNLVALGGESPLIGPHEPEAGTGVRFVDLYDAYDPALRALAHAAAEERGIASRVREGVYAMVAGPAYETPAEIRFLRVGGADAVGMSTAHEVIVARHEGMRVLGVSAITNVHRPGGVGGGPTHEEVLAEGERLKPRFVALVEGVLARLAAEATERH